METALVLVIEDAEPFDEIRRDFAAWDVARGIPFHVAFMSALHARFPEWPPYGGAHDQVHPHATLGQDVDPEVVRGEIERRLAPHLPHWCQARDVSLLEEYEPDRWRERERFPLGG
jgi:hypothetical protein